MADIFISYKSSDRPRAQALRTWFEQCGWTVWMDREAQIGSAWSDEIQAELDVAKVVVVLWGAQARRSEWVVREATLALETGRLVQVLATGLPLLPPFYSVQSVRMESWTGDDAHSEKARLLQAVARRLGVEEPQVSKPLVPALDVDLDRFALVELVLDFCSLQLAWRSASIAGRDPSASIDEVRATFDDIVRSLTRTPPGVEVSVWEDPLHPMLGTFLDALETLGPDPGAVK